MVNKSHKSDRQFHSKYFQKKINTNSNNDDNEHLPADCSVVYYETHSVLVSVVNVLVIEVP